MAVHARIDRLASFTPSVQLLSLLFTVTGITAMAAALYLAQSRSMMFALLAMAGMLLAIFVLIRPEIGVTALVGCAAAVRLTIGTGTDTALVASLLVAGLLLVGWSVHQMLHDGRLMLVPGIVALPAALLVGATIFSLIWGRLALDPRIYLYPEFIRVQVAAVGLIVISVGLLFVGADLFREPHLRTIVCGCIVVVGAIALPFRAMSMEVPILNTAGLFGIWFVAICWGHALGNDELPDAARFVLGALAIGWLAMAITREQSWVSGWLPALVAFMIVTVATRRRIGTLLVLLSGIGLAFYNSLFYDMLVTQQQHDGSLGGEFGRLQLWARNLEVVSDHLLFGTGPAGYALYYVTFVPDRAMSTHSNYVDTLAQTGVFGLVGLLALLVGLWIVSRRTLRVARSGPDRATAAALVGGVPAVAASLWLGDWLIPFVYNQTIAGFDHAVYSWLMFAIVCGLYAQLRQESLSDA